MLTQKLKEEFMKFKSIPEDDIYESNDVKDALSNFGLRIMSEGFDFNKLTVEEKLDLGFIHLDKETDNNILLVPLYIFHMLDDNFKLQCIFTDLIDDKINCGDEARGGCIAYYFPQ